MKKSIVAIALALATLAPQGAHAVAVFPANGHEYDIVSAEGITWTDARAAALALGGGWDLATITSAAEDAFVIGLLPVGPAERSHFWLGATDQATEGTFAWVTGESFLYTNWWVGEPNNFGNEDFLAYDFRAPAFAWNDAPDSLPLLVRGYVIERAVPAPEPASLALLGVGLAGLGALRRRRLGQPS